MLMKNKSDFRCAVVHFCYHLYNNKSNSTPLSPIIFTYISIGLEKKFKVLEAVKN